MARKNPLDTVRELLGKVGSSGLLGPGVQAFTNPQLRQNTITPLARGVRAGVNISPPVAFSRGLAGKVNPKQSFQDIKDFARGVGVLTTGPAAQVTGGLLGGVVSKATGGNFTTGMNQGITAAQTYGPLAKFVTTPAINRFVPSGILANRVGQSGANVLEGIGLDLTMGNRIRPEGIAFDAIAGLVSPSFNRPGAVGKGFDVGRNRNTAWDQRDVNMLDEINDYLHGNKKLTLEDINNVDSALSRLARGYLPNLVMEKLANKYKSDSRGYIRALSKELSKAATKAEEAGRTIRPQDEFGMNQIKMGFASSVPPKRTNIQKALINALHTGSNEPVNFGRLSPNKFKELNQKLTSSGQAPLASPDVLIHPRVIEKLIEKRINLDKMTPDQVADVAYSAIHGKSKILSTREPQIKAFVKAKGDIANTAYVGQFGGKGSLKSVHPKELKKIQKESLGGRGNPPSGAIKLNPAAPIPAIQDSSGNIIPPSFKDFMEGRINDVVSSKVMKSKTKVPKGFTQAGDIGNRPPGSALTQPTKGKLEVGGGKYGIKRFNTTPEIDDTIREAAKNLEPQIKDGRGGTKSMEQTLTEAKGVTLEEATLGTSKVAGDALVVAQGNWIKTLSEQIDALKKSGSRGTEIAAKQKQLDDLIVTALAKTSTSAGRALKAHQYLSEVMSQDAQTQLKRVVTRSPERWGDTKKVVEMLNKFEPNDRLGMIKLLSEIDKSTPLNKLESIWYNNILSNTSTQLANLIGNEGRHWWHLATKPFRVATDVGVSAFTGQPRQEFMREMMPELAGSVVGYRQGVRKALFAFRHGVRTSDLEKLNVPEKALKGRVGSAISTPSRLLVAGDEFFRTVNETMEIYRQAASTAAKEGLKGDVYNARMGELIASPTPDMVKNAQKLAEDLLFQNVSKELRAVGGLRDMFKFDIPKLGTVRPMRFVIPFIQVPLNVAKFGFEASPVGIGTTALKGKTLPRAEFNRKMASGVLGTMTTVALASLVVEDKLTGRQPKNQKEADAFYAQGKLPYSVRIGDTWVQYNRLPEPLASQLTNLAVLYDEFRDNPEASLSQKAGAYTLGMVRGLADRTFLQGIGDLMNAVEDPERYGKNFLQNIATGFIPASSLTAATARAIDPVVRDPQNLSEAVQAKVPGLSQNVTPRDSGFEEGGVAVRKTPAIQNFLPIKTSQQKDLNAKQVTQLPAKAMLKELKRFTPEQKKVILAYVKKNNPTLFSNVKRELLDKKLGTSKEEITLRNRSVAERARTIKLELSRADSREEKIALLKDYKAKGILTDSVLAELKR